MNIFNIHTVLDLVYFLRKCLFWYSPSVCFSKDKLLKILRDLVDLNVDDNLCN